MATLNIKGFPDELYEKLRREAEKEHRSISQQVIHMLSKLCEDRKKLSLLDLQGLGKEVWRGVDAAEYVAAERDSWD